MSCRPEFHSLDITETEDKHSLPDEPLPGLVMELALASFRKLTLVTF